MGKLIEEDRGIRSDQTLVYMYTKKDMTATKVAYATRGNWAGCEVIIDPGKGSVSIQLYQCKIETHGSCHYQASYWIPFPKVFLKFRRARP